MKWIALAIVLFMAGYTFVTLQYRKPNRAYEPYNDIKQRGQTRNLLTAGYQRIPVRLDRPNSSQPIHSPATVTESEGGLPIYLTDSLFDQPVLADSFANLSASGHSNELMPYTLIVESQMADEQLHLLSTAQLYLRNNQAIIVPEIKEHTGGVLTRRRDTRMRLIIPGGAFQPGTYEIKLVGAKSSLKWTLQVH